MIIPKYKTTFNFIHHILHLQVVSSYIGYFNYYASYHAVYVETNLFLTFNEIIKIIDFEIPN